MLLLNQGMRGRPFAPAATRKRIGRTVINSPQVLSAAMVVEHTRRVLLSCLPSPPPPFDPPVTPRSTAVGFIIHLSHDRVHAIHLQ
jgi:hypothetical protein